ncbi:MAG: hypothetical protein BWY43_00007 [candidate division WS2 bacterium ADurb.Bin280]|uniref:Uncharacterized protein n=1 Tax=candidate division WS2 bacterium ADurb.Bin280 TaxID=1852829 RepID=A0A1V5SG15_9BACT|nr:MAG: hypothetical protein BWY43_00007 [candidate division WS2 bacterium ADurb.Bin280]
MIVLYYVVCALLGAGVGSVVRAIIWGAAWFVGVDFVTSTWWFVGGGAIVGFIIALLCLEASKYAFRELMLR